MHAFLTSLLIFAIVATVWSYLPVPNPLKLIGWLILGVAFVLKFLLPLLA